MVDLVAGVTRDGEGLDGIAWNVLGQTYVPKGYCDTSFGWHATLPKGTFVPPHIHPTQDEFILMLEGRLDFILDGKEGHAVAGDLLNLPMGIMHGLFSNQETPVKCLFWVSPARKLYQLFEKLHNLTDVEEVVRLSAEHEVNFLPPPA